MCYYAIAQNYNLCCILSKEQLPTEWRSFDMTWSLQKRDIICYLLITMTNYDARLKSGGPYFGQPCSRACSSDTEPCVLSLLARFNEQISRQDMLPVFCRTGSNAASIWQRPHSSMFSRNDTMAKLYLSTRRRHIKGVGTIFRISS